MVYKYIWIISVFLMASCVVHAQVMPAPGAILNYRLAGFSVGARPDIVNYVFEIVADSVTDEQSFAKKEMLTENSSENKCIILLPAFDTKYTWRVRYINDYNETVFKTQLYHFKTGITKFADTTRYRLKILIPANHHTDKYILVDYSLVMYDLNGNPLWYMPDIPELADREGVQMKGFKANADGTFTIITRGSVYTADYNGRIVWSACGNGKESGDTNGLSKGRHRDKQGSVSLQDDDCRLVCTGVTNKMFIINKTKEIVWDAILQVNDINGTWMNTGPCRVNYLDNKGLEKSIFYEAFVK